MNAGDVADVVIGHRRLVIVLFLVLTGVMAVGAAQVEEETSLEAFQSDSSAAAAQERMDDRFAATGANVTTAQVVVREGNVLDRETLLETLEYQRTVRENDDVGPTLADERPTTSVASAVATTAVARERGSADAQRNESGAAGGDSGEREEPEPPSLDAQIAQLESMSDAEVRAVVEATVTEDRDRLLSLLPADYEPGTASASATLVVVRQDTGGEYVSLDTAPDEIVDAQRAMLAIGEDRDGADYRVFGPGITAAELNDSLEESLAVVGPFALLFVLVVLTVAYRDPVDVALGVLGIGLVLLWTLGFMGWVGIDFGQLFVAVPVLLIGLSIDYAIHVFMRGREARSGTDRSVGDATAAALGGVGVALVLVTVTTAIGFLSNVVSPVAPIREFGVVNAAGIVAALLIFALLVPALKVEIDGWLEGRGIDRRATAFGSGGVLRRALSGGASVARHAPAIVVVLALLVSVGGAYGATQVDTSFETEDFLADDPPAWTEHLPASMEPREYTAVESMRVLEDRFFRQDLDAHLLVEGDVTDPSTLERLAEARSGLPEDGAVATLQTGEPAVEDPGTAMSAVAAEDERFAATLSEHDTDGDGLPDRNVATVYDALYAADPAAAGRVIDRTHDGEYRSVRLTVLAAGSDDVEPLVDAVRDAEASVEGEGVEVTPTGRQTVLNREVEEDVFSSVVDSLLVTLAAVALLLVGAYRLSTGRGSLGLVTVVPVALALSWILGLMAVLEIPFNTVTGLITSLTVGLGVAYSIHVTERFHQELASREDVAAALDATLVGTGGALLGSAATTAVGFGVLTLSFMPALGQFGLITAASIVLAFLASVAVLPSMLALWTRFFGPEWARIELGGADGTAATAPGPGDD